MEITMMDRWLMILADIQIALEQREGLTADQLDEITLRHSIAKCDTCVSVECCDFAKLNKLVWGAVNAARKL